LGIVIIPFFPFIANVLLRISYVDEFSFSNFISFILATWIEGTLLVRLMFYVQQRHLDKSLPLSAPGDRTVGKPVVRVLVVIAFHLVRFIRKFMQSNFAVLIAVGIGAFSSVVDYEFMTIAGSPLDHHVLRLIGNNSQYIKSANTSWNNGEVTFIGIPLSVWMILSVYFVSVWITRKIIRKYFSADGKCVQSVVPFKLIGFLFALLLYWNQHIGVVTQNLRAVVFSFEGGGPNLFATEGIPDAQTFNMYQEGCLKNRKPNPNFNVVFLLNEGISSTFMNSENGIKAAPFYHKFMKEQRAHIFNYTAVATAGVTEVSISNFLTGFTADHKLVQSSHRNPSMWALAKSACFSTTALYASQKKIWSYE